MKLKQTFGLVVFTLLLWGSAFSWLSLAQSPPGSRLTLVSATSGEIVLELTVADYQVEPITVNGQRYQSVLIGATAQTDRPGAPQLPTRGALLGLPTTSGVKVEILEADVELLQGYRLPPAPTLRVAGESVLEGTVEEVYAPDEPLYRTAAFYPGRPVEINRTAMLRDQAVAQVQFYPVQVNPVSGELRLYRRILARVSWAETSLAAADTRPASPAYEPVLQSTLLNYSSLSRPSVDQPAPAKPATGDIHTADIAPSLKIGVAEDGLYQLTYGDIVGAGFDLTGLDPRTIQITNQGHELPIFVVGEEDGLFDPNDSILFYGTALTNVYTVENIYWLTAGPDPGQRISRRDGTPQAAPVPAHFPVTLHAEEDTSYWQSMPNGQGQDHWFWGGRLSAPAARDYSIGLNNLSALADTITLTARLKGRSAVAEVSPDHHTKLYVNGIDVAPAGHWWDGQSTVDQQLILPATVFTEGNNVLRVEGVGDTGAAVDQFYVNWFELEYWHTYVAENNELTFAAPASGTYQFEVSGFSSNTVQLFDVTDPADVALMTHTTVTSDVDSYLLRFTASARPESRYLAVSPDRYKLPSRLELEQPSSWKSTGIGADYIIITPQDFYTSALTLAQWRTAAGWRTVTVKVEDIYDEFAAGIFHPPAIRDFLAYAYANWVPPAPTYVLLLGDATYDYKDNYGTGKINYVPAPIIETDLLGQTPADNWFAAVSGEDILPDLLIGRLSAIDVTQVDQMIAKIRQYELSSPDAAWKSQVLLVADDDVSTFVTLSDQLAALLPATFTTTKVYAANYPPGDPTVDIDTRINLGTLLVNYTGHGNSTQWGSWSGGRIYDIDNILALNNPGRLPVVAVANCFNGFFTSPFETTSFLPLAEAFVRLPAGGAVAVWAPTGLGYPSGHQALMTEFYRAMFQEEKYSLGAATTAAKVAIAGQNPAWDELVETYVFFGDPAMGLAVPGAGNVPARPIYLPVVIKSEE